MSNIKYYKNRLGSKFYKYIDDELEIIRILEVKEDDSILVWNYRTKEQSTLDIDKLDRYVQILPDAKMDIMITSYDRSESTKDVYVWVYKTDDISKGISQPKLVIRQDVVNQLKTMDALLSQSNLQYVGIGMTDYINNTSGRPLLDISDFHHVIDNCTIDLYVMDTSEEIFRNIPSGFKSKVNEVLENISKISETSTFVGFSKSLESLLKDNEFIPLYRSIFNIRYLDITIDSSKTPIELSEEQKHYIEDLLSKYIDNIDILECRENTNVYAYVIRKHIIISDASEKIYIMAYDEIGSYSIDDDIANVFGAQNFSKEDIENALDIKL